MAKILLILFLLVPIGEIYVLLTVGSLIGVPLTIAMIVLTAITGAAMIRIQGISTLMRVRQSLEQGQIPAVELLEGACLLVAGALLLTPGFITDSIGFTLLVPALRRGAIGTLLRQGILHGRNSAHPHSQASGSGHIIEGEYTRKDS